MKRLIIATIICLAFAVSAAFANDGADLFNKRCGKCHGMDGAKVSGASGGTKLQGQSSEDILKKLTGYKEGTYGGAKKKTMERMISRMTDEQIAELATYIGSL